LILIAATPMVAQDLPASPERPWHSSEERRIANEATRLRRSLLRIEPDKIYSLAELIDLAETHNPETRVARALAKPGHEFQHRIATARETLGRLVRAFRALPEPQQLALELVRVEGFSMAVAAENLGVTLPSLKMSVFRGAAALRDAVLEAAQPRGVRGPSDAEKEQLRGIT